MHKEYKVKLVNVLLGLGIATNLVSCTTVTPQMPAAGTTTTASTEQTGAPTSQPIKESFADRQKHLAALQTWQIAGKVAVHTTQDSGSASVTWQQSGQQYQVSLMGPFGAGSMKLTGGPAHVRLTTADGKQYNSNSAEQLLAKQWGYHLPVNNLNYWIRGIPVKGVPYQARFDKANRLIALQQAGWQVQFMDYRRHGAVDLPTKVFANGNMLNAKFVIYNWQIR